MSTESDRLTRIADANRRRDKATAALVRIADLCADGVVTLGQIEYIARAALTPPLATGVPPVPDEGGER